MTETADHQTPLATLLHLSKRARSAQSASELRFSLLNESLTLVQYRQSALWLNDEGLCGLSGVVSLDANSPYVHSLKRLFAHIKSEAVLHNHSDAIRLDSESLAEVLRDELSQWMPSQIVVVPIPSSSKTFAGGCIVFARECPWLDEELMFLQEWVSAWSVVYALKQQRSFFDHIKRVFYNRGQGADIGLNRGATLRVTLAFSLLLFMYIPVNITVLAPAEMIPLNPSIIRVPIDGVVSSINVRPNEYVEVDQVLFELDRSSLDHQIRVSEQQLETIKAEYRQAAQQALFDPNVKTKLALVQGQLKEKGAEMGYLDHLSQRMSVVAPREGIVFFGDPTEKLGKPMMTGEKVMMIADEKQVEVEAWLSPADAIDLELGSPVKVFLSSNPLSPILASLDYIAHEATPMPDGRYAYRIRASLTQNSDLPRVGLKGTAKFRGERSSLLYAITRRPLAAARAWLGV